MSRGDIAVGALVGYVASRAMDAATRWYHPLQSDESRRREQEIAPGGTLVQVGRQLGGSVGRELDDAAAGRVGLALHRTFGACYGIAAVALVRSGRRPLAASLAVAAAAFVLVDEGTSISQVTV
jgi:hypothetical protein